MEQYVPLWSAMHGGSGNDQEEEDGNQSENPPRTPLSAKLAASCDPDLASNMYFH